MNEIERFLLQERPSQILLAVKRLGNPYISTISKDVDCTYAHTSRVIKKMRKLGLVSLKAQGRVKYVELTSLGSGVAQALRKISKAGETRRR
ncbi:MAG: winged helix DNA-binding protein [Euryarchaeota archaeon]|nr:winged helix DNA-binding protein [Euryarchaeota archaeon]